MIIERKKDEVIFKVSSKLNIDQLQAISNWLEFMEIASRSKAKEKDVDDLVASVKKGRWEKKTKLLSFKTLNP